MSRSIACLLGVLIGDEYAECFFELTGRYPRWVPVSGMYQSNRKWCRCYLLSK